MSSGKKMSKQDIITYLVAGVALLLALIVVLGKFGVFGKNEEETTTMPESTVVVASETMENGSVVYYTMVEHYEKPHVSSFYVYPTKEKASTTKGTTTSPVVEETRGVQVTNEDGIPLLDEWGQPVTKIETYTVDSHKKTTKASQTEKATKTDEEVTDAEENTAAQSETQKTEAPAEEVTTAAAKETSAEG